MTLRTIFPLLFLTASASVHGGDAKQTIEPKGDWNFSFSAGPAWRQSGTFSFDGGSRSGGFFIPSQVGENSLSVPAIGSESEIGDRLYDDGFVRVDPSTSVDGMTTYWGYENAGQAAGDTLSFHATGFRSARSDSLSTSSAPSYERDQQTIAPYLQFDGTYQREFYGFRPGFSASLSWARVEEDRHWSDLNLAQVRDDFRQDWTDEYNLGGFGGLIPTAPYSGTAAGPGFVLENLPDDRTMTEVLIGSENALITNAVKARFRADHATFSFGPTLKYQLAPEWNLEGGAGVSIHWLRWSASQSETLRATMGSGSTTVLGRWRDSSSGNEVLGGLYLQMAAEWAPERLPWSVKALLRGDLGQEFSEKIGPSTFSYDVDGYTAAVLLTRRF